MNPLPPFLARLVSLMTASQNSSEKKHLLASFTEELNHRYKNQTDLLMAWTQLEKHPKSLGRQQVFFEETVKTGAHIDKTLLDILDKHLEITSDAIDQRGTTVTAQKNSAVAVGHDNTVLGPGAISIRTGDIKANKVVIKGTDSRPGKPR